MNSRSKRRPLTAGIAFVLLVAGVGLSCDSSTSPANDDIVLGGAFSLTGNWSTLGLTSKAAMEIAVADVNTYYAGQGLHFSADVQDTKLDPQIALTKLQDFKGKGVKIVIGPQSSAEVAVLKPYVDANGIILVSQSSTAGSLAVSNDNVYRFTPSDTLEGVAIAAFIAADGLQAIIPIWRADAGNQGLAVATRREFLKRGGTVSAGIEYGTTTTNFATTLATLTTQVNAAIAQNGASKVGVYLAAFDEAADIFAAAAAIPALGSVKWYGSDGVALSTVVIGNAAAAAFANQVSYPNPIFGLDESSKEKWASLAAQIKTKSGIDPDAFALGVYDAVWVAASAYVAAGADADVATLKTKFVASANSYFGATSWTALDAAGDRKYADFDFFAIRKVGSTSQWTRVGQYDTKLGVLTR
ncbi:MAG TPA: ABC transporter substrate-binding protein [Gemmatimonadaceae bacterium]|nr:ABC transporter substrate-binding protein [Gemmatimonadaceae bacterium]